MKPNNPEAFPRPASLGNNYLTGEEGVVVDPQRGMTLRDYFAAKAMQSMLTAYQGIPYPMDNLSTRAYAQADSMLKAREE